jgi:hypothetical protein
MQKQPSVSPHNVPIVDTTVFATLLLLLLLLYPHLYIRLHHIITHHCSYTQATADATEGFSGREIAKLAIAWQAAAYGTQGSVFTHELMIEVLSNHLQQKGQKQQWAQRALIKASATTSIKAKPLTTVEVKSATADSTTSSSSSNASSSSSSDSSK